MVRCNFVDCHILRLLIYTESKHLVSLFNMGATDITFKKLFDYYLIKIKFPRKNKQELVMSEQRPCSRPFHS